MAVYAPIWKGLPGGALTETPESGGLVMAERCTYTQALRGRKSDAYTFALAHPRGSQWYLSLGDSFGEGLFYVEDCNVATDKGGKGTVTTKYVYLGIVPPDEFSLPPFEVNPALQKHPFFATLTEDDLAVARQSYNAATANGQTSLKNAITGRPNADLITKLINKWLKGEETYYLAGYTFMHTVFFSTAPSESKGGFIENPWGSFAGYVSASGLQWLRKADEVGWSNGLWKLTRTWIGGPAGHWDTDLYPGP